MHNLKTKTRDEILEYVSAWFLSRYEDPSIRTPYVDGEYLYIDGGPYDCREELGAEFCDLVDSAILDNAAEEITACGTVDWAPSEFHPDMDPFDIQLWEHEAWVRDHNPYEVYRGARAELDSYIKEALQGRVNPLVYRMVFVQAWSILEGFLFGVLVQKVRLDVTVVERFFSRDPSLRDVNFKGAQLVREPDLPRIALLRHLEKISYHNIPRIIKLLENVFGSFEKMGVNVKPLSKIAERLVEKRHDCVHRNGMSVNNKITEVNQADITDQLEFGDKLVDAVRTLIGDNQSIFDDEIPF